MKGVPHHVRLLFLYLKARFAYLKGQYDEFLYTWAGKARCPVIMGSVALLLPWGQQHGL